MNNENGFVFIYPKRLVLINSSWCDFCNKNCNESYIEELVHLFGYQRCKNCEEICKKHIYLYSKHNNNYSTKNFVEHLKISSREQFKVQRSSGDIENNWYIDCTRFIKLRNNEYLIPLYSHNVSKYVDLKKLCNDNNSKLDYDIIRDYFVMFN